MTRCMVRPCVARGFHRSVGLGSCINVFGLSLERVVPRAITDISAPGFSLADRPRMGHSGQGQQAPGRPVLHLVSPSRRPRHFRFPSSRHAAKMASNHGGIGARPSVIPIFKMRRQSPLDGAEHGRRMHVPAGPISSDRNTVDRSCLSLPLVPTRDRDRARAQRPL
jgi:hypothetical protein